MKKQLLLTAIVSSCLTACGGGSSSDGSSPGTLTGTLSDISGLGYTSGNQTGVVSADGKFNYEAGKTISFYLGGIKITEVTASESLSLADLFPDLPETAADFRREMRNLDFSKEISQIKVNTATYSYGTKSDLHKASNLMQLMLALDEDRDSSNGIDLLTSAWHNQLTEISEEDLPFHTHLLDFKTQPEVSEFQQKYSVSLAMDQAEPLAVLYNMVGKSIVVNPVYQSVQTNNEQNTVDYQFNDKYQLTSMVTTNSSQPSTSSHVEERDNNGNLIRMTNILDVNSDDVFEGLIEVTSTYNDYGVQLTSTTRQFENNDEIHPIQDTTYHYTHENDRLLISSSARVNNLSPTSTVTKTTSTYNPELKLVEWVSEGVNPITEEVTETNLKYEYSYLDDGRPEGSGKTYYANGEVSRTEEQTLIYLDNQTTSNILTTANNTGISTRQRISEVFDDTGKITSKRLEQFNPEGTLTGSSVVNYTYDEVGRINSCIYESDSDADGTVDGLSRMRSVFNEFGITEWHFEADSNLDGVFDQNQASYDFTYGDNGEMLVDGMRNFQTFKYADNPATNGVRYLIMEHFLIDRGIFVRQNKCYASLM